MTSGQHARSLKHASVTECKWDQAMLQSCSQVGIEIQPQGCQLGKNQNHQCGNTLWLPRAIGECWHQMLQQGPTLQILVISM